jgi:DNA gyrase/topoisomerase IV subunit B
MLEYNEIESLSEIEWLHNRPETYIGTTNHPTHLFEEVFDNALDEVLNGGKSVIIKIKPGFCSIEDGGRGFPVGEDESGMPYPVKACTKLYTSGKFNKNVKAYKISAGLNGIGLVAVTGLSEQVRLISYREGYAHEYTFNTSFKEHKIDYEIKDKVKSNKCGTYISFTPSSKIFRSNEFDVEYIKERVKLAKMLTDANIDLYINDNLIDIDVDKSKLIDMFFDDNQDELCTVKTEIDGQKYNVSLYYSYDKNEPRFKGSVNLLPIHDGTHIKYIKTILPDVLIDLMPKNKVLNKSDYLVGLRCFIENTIQEPRFSGQTKLKLSVDLKRYDVFTKNFTKELKKQLKDSLNLESLYQRFLDYKQGLNLRKTRSKVKKRKFSASLLDSHKHGESSSLYIVEGDSAAGSLVKCRDKNKHAIFTLFGKSMPNVETSTNAKILANKTVIDLFNVLGKDHDIEPLNDTSNLKYGKIMITTDPDIDGYHITVMVMKFFNRFFPKIIEEKRLYLPQIPLYAYYEGKKFIPIYDEAKVKEMFSKGKELMRHKGLGEFDPDELEVVLFKENSVIQVTKDMIVETPKQEDSNLKDEKVKEVSENKKDSTSNDGIIKDDGNTKGDSVEDMLSLFKKENKEADEELPDFSDFKF